MGVSELVLSPESSERRLNEAAGTSKDLVNMTKLSKQDADDANVNRIDDDREEGEIVDDYEFIISSDEELCMRQRIEELEAKNAELEKIAHITDDYVNDYSYSGKHDTHFQSNERYPLASINAINLMGCQRAAQVPTDVSSISSVEFPTPKKRKRRLSKGSRKEHKIERNRGDTKKHKHSSKRSNTNRIRGQKDKDPIQVDSYDSSDDNLSNDDSTACFLSREELRFALARSSNMDKNTGTLKDRLINKVVNLNKKNEFEARARAFPSPEPIVIEDDNSDGSVSLEEQELRLIALKSAVMKKHMARKKRDAEVAYSPTDFEDMLSGTAILSQVVDADIDEIDNDTKNSMEISPVASPKLYLTPDNGENSRMSMDSDIIEVTEAVNTKPVDMDIATSESEGELQSYYYEDKKWVPIEEIPLPSMSDAPIEVSQNLLQVPYEGIFYPNAVHYNNFFSKTHVEPPPLPPGVFDFDELPPPPPPFHLHSPSTEIGNLNKVKIEKNIWEDSYKEQQDTKTNQSSSSDVIKNDNKEVNEKEKYLLSSNACKNIQSEEDDNEEEEALRALLLSKFNSPKAFKSENNSSKRVSSPLASDLSQEAEDPETLRLLLLNSMNNQKAFQNPTESILKEAVRRLKMKTYSSNCFKRSEMKHNVSQKSRSHSPVLIQKKSNRDNTFDQEKVQCKNLLEIGGERKHNVSQKSRSHSPVLIQKKSNRDNTFDQEKVECTNLLEISQSSALNYFQINTTILDKHIEESVEKSIVLEQCTEIRKTSEKVQKIDHLTDHVGIRVENKQSNIGQVDDGKVVTNSKECLLLPDEVQSDAQIESASIENHVIQPLNDLDTPPESVICVKNQQSSHNETTMHLGQEIIKINSSDTSTSISINKENLEKECLVNDSKISDTTFAKSTITSFNKTDLPINNSPELKIPLRSNKIVKPNKVINTQSIIKRKSVENMPFLSKQLKSSSSPASPIPSVTTVSNNNNSRLVTSASISAMQVKKLIITLGSSESDTSEDDMISCIPSRNKINNNKLFESINKTCTSNDYFDNKSPISLPMDSPADTPRRANSPCIDSLKNDSPKAVNECFEEKLDTFLKSVRSKVQNTAVASDVKELETKETNSDSLKSLSTPLAVRHLPHASQQEYRRLVHRMQLLEKQKHAKKIEKGNNFSSLSGQEHMHMNDNLSYRNSKIGNVKSAPSSCEITKKPLFKTVLLKNANSTVPAQETAGSRQVKKSNMQQASKSNLLRAYESSFLKSGAGIVTNLDKSLKLVEEAKLAKITKLNCEKRISELRSEMEEVQKKLKQGQLKISKIYPEICASNDIITNLKQRRTKFFKAATNLGKTLKGDEYRLNNDLKNLISVKSKKLADEIKFVNSMKLIDIEKLIHKEKDEITKLDINASVPTSDNEPSTCKVSMPINDLVPYKSEIATEKTENEKSCLIDVTVSKQPITLIHKPDKNLPICCKSSESDFTKEQSRNCIQNCEQTCLDEHVEINEKINSCEIDDNELCVEKAENLEKVVEVAKENNEVTPCDLAVDEGGDEVSSKSLGVREYISPLAYLKTDERRLDPNGIVCPYDLMGQCADHDCKFVHLGSML